MSERTVETNKEMTLARGAGRAICKNAIAVTEHEKPEHGVSVTWIF